MYHEILCKPVVGVPSMVKSIGELRGRYNIKFDFKKVGDELIGIAILYLPTRRLAAIEYGSKRSLLFTALLKKLSIQLSKKEQLAFQSSTAFH